MDIEPLGERRPQRLDWLRHPHPKAFPGMSIESRLAELGINLPAAAPPVAAYVPTVITGGLLYISGQLPFDEIGALITGRLGEDIDIERGYHAAQRCAVMLIAQMQGALGDLDRVERIVKLGVFVASDPRFTDQAKVGNGASDLMVSVFGDAGRHARSAVAAPVLPLGAAVEIDAIVAIRG